MRAEAALERSETSYRAIFESAEDCIFVHDWDTGAIVDVNPTACRTYGWSREEMLRLDVGDVQLERTALHASTRHWPTSRRPSAGEVVRFEWHRRNRDGSLHWDEVMLKAADNRRPAARPRLHPRDQRPQAR